MLVLPLFALGVLSGCNDSGPSTNYVEGVVTLDGQPLEGVQVDFSPVGSGTAATGTTDARGVYKLTAMPNGAFEKGAEAGEYNVVFFKFEGGSSGPSLSANDPGYEEAYRASMAGGSAPQARAPKQAFPDRYSNPATSGFNVTVKQGRNTGDEFNFDLKSQ